MAKANPAVQMAPQQTRHNCNWQPQFDDGLRPGELAVPGYPLRTCDDMQRIFKQKHTTFLAKEDYLDVGLRACDGVKYVALIREPLDRIRSHIQWLKFTDAQVHYWSSGGALPIHPIGVRCREACRTYRSYRVCVIHFRSAVLSCGPHNHHER
jgi:hypothetical protein